MRSFSGTHRKHYSTSIPILPDDASAAPHFYYSASGRSRIQSLIAVDIVQPFWAQKAFSLKISDSETRIFSHRERSDVGILWVDRYHIVPEALQMEVRKECLDCQESKIITDFCLTKWTKDGRNNRCKECVNAKARKKYEENRQEVLARQRHRRAINPEPDRKYRSENREKCLERSRKWKEKNKDYCRFYCQEYEKRRDKSQVAERTRRRAVAKNNACPPWLTSSHRREMRLMFLLAQDLTARTGVKYHVDHIVPLKNSFCCGLHVPWNLRVIKASENLKKGNKFIPELGLTAC